ncbi:MAG: pentapeptide repeat-containing protein [SAR324 cluster bacterium]|nr:pentapeptide repeat-containing protein [SAR324 cluster bacterium]
MYSTVHAIRIALLALLIGVWVLPVGGQASEEWKGTLRKGEEIDRKDLEMMLARHRLWLAEVADAGLPIAEAVEMRFRSELRAAFGRADLSGAHLQDAQLRGGDFSKSDLSDAVLWDADLGQAEFWEANLRGAKLIRVNLERAVLMLADMRGADLVGAEMSGANLREADLRQADLIAVNLTGADLTGADLRGVDFEAARLSGAVLDAARLSGAIYQPKLGSQPDIGGMARAHDLHLMTFLDSPAGLMELRARFRSAGLDDQARQITYAIFRTQRQQSMSASFGINYLKGLAMLVFLEWTSAYGLAPERPLLLVLALGLICGVIYWAAIRLVPALGVVWITQWPGKQWFDIRKQTAVWHKAVRIGLYFSLCSSLPFVHQISALQLVSVNSPPVEYRLRATGWLRLVSGLQAVASLYLLTLATATLLARPFG